MPKLEGIGDLELILITVAVLFEPVSAPMQISEADVLKVLKRPVTMSQAVNGSLVISSNRDQKEIILSPNKVDVRDSSENVDEAKTRFFDFVHIFEMPLLGYGGYLPFGLETFAAYHFAAGLIGWSSDASIPSNSGRQDKLVRPVSQPE